MNYQETIDYLYSRLPMFTRDGKDAFKPSLDNTIALCKQLDEPQGKFRSIHIGGTNGKGSTSHMLAAILQTAGYKTGLYTSPHLRDFRERIRINGEMISEEEVVDFVQQQQKNVEEIEPSFFELTVAMAFDHFARHQVDIAVIEVGLGGRLDSTNIISPLVSVITNIGYDHMNMLGNTLQLIAAEKAGIIKPGVPVVIGEKHEETEQVFITKAKETGSELVFASDEWTVKLLAVDSWGSAGNEQRYLELEAKPSNFSTFEFSTLNLTLDLTGSYQLKNIKTVLSSVTELQKQGFIITPEHLTKALKNVQGLTGLQGRWQILDTHPLVICDTGHNEDGIREVLKNILNTPHKQLHMVIGMVKDKDTRRVLGLLPKTAQYYFCQPDIPRAKDASELASEALDAGLSGNTYPAVKDALLAAKQAAGPKDLIFVGGSTFVVAEVV